MSRRKKVSAKSQPTTSVQLPFYVDVLAGLLAGTKAETRAAFKTAHTALDRHYADPFNAEYPDICDELSRHVLRYAKSYSPEVRKALAADHGNMEGELINAFAEPGYWLGMATAVLMLRGDVDVTGGAR